MKGILALAMVAAVASGTSAKAGTTLDAVKQRGELICGVSTGSAGFAVADKTGAYKGLDVDLCHAIAAAVLNAPDKVKYVPLTGQQRLTALQSGEIDILSRNTTWTLTREALSGLLFGPTIFYDGQGFIVPKKLGVKSAKELNGATVCVSPGTTTELNLADYARLNHITFKPVSIESLDEVESTFIAGRCDVYTNDATSLAGMRLTKAPNPDDYVILPERISKEPLSPAVRQGDDQWFDILRWTVFALVEAEEKGITAANVDQMQKSDDPEVKRLLGVTPGNGKALGLDEAWAARAIRAAGNYGEMFDRNLGKGSPLKLERGLNDLWSKGGLIYAPPLR
ncbi:amino acid ABC transporter substrate-binding protein [Aliidongia dinghuensis]|nr:amino acid ABC transporter substrate-binding protein [Aliidongia dinghuensis]